MQVVNRSSERNYEFVQLISAKMMYELRFEFTRAPDFLYSPTVILDAVREA